MTDFHDRLFPLCFDLRPKSESARTSNTLVLDSGFRATVFSSPNTFKTYEVSFKIRDAALQRSLISFFECRKGKLYSFRFTDWADHTSSNTDVVGIADQVVGIGDGVNNIFQVVKNYIAPEHTYKRPIQAIKPETFVLAVNGVQVTSGFTITDTGVLLFNDAPANNAVITCGYQFDTVVRFDTDDLVYLLDDAYHMPINALILKEVFRRQLDYRRNLYLLWLSVNGPTPEPEQWLAFLQENAPYEWAEVY